jgi:hypothetical protein
MRTIHSAVAKKIGPKESSLQSSLDADSIVKKIGRENLVGHSGVFLFIARTYHLELIFVIYLIYRWGV